MLPVRRCCLLIALLAVVAGPGLLPAQERGIADFPKLDPARDWPWWRGPLRNGDASAAGAVPTQLNPQAALWKTPVPGRGHSSPTVVGERVFLTTADKSTQTHSVLAFDRASGKPLWKTDVSQGGFPAANHPKNTEATSTVACDGERLFTAFYHKDTVQASALSLDGKIQWQVTVGAFRPRRYEYGYAPSPMLYRDTVIIAGEYDGPSFITALDRRSGKPAWKITRPTSISFSTPALARVAGRDQLLISGADQVASYDPATGKPLWSVPGTTAATCGTMVWEGDTVFASGGYPKAETIAVKADGSRTVLWKNGQKCYEQSMIVVDGYVYGLTDNGVLYCWQGTDGKVMWMKRLQGPVSASPVLAGGHIYQANENGILYVWKPNPAECELVAENQIGSDSFPSPAVCGGQIFLRVAESGRGGSRQEMLYCFGRR